MDELLNYHVTWRDRTLTVREWLASGDCIVDPNIALMRITAGWKMDAALTAKLMKNPVRLGKRPGDNVSHFRGVSFHYPRNAWQARIIHEGKKYYLGYYKNEFHAAAVYNLAARKLLGDNAKLNEA